MQELTTFQNIALLDLVRTKIGLEYSKNESLGLDSDYDNYLRELEIINSTLLHANSNSITEQQIFMLLDLVQDVILKEQDIDDFYLDHLGDIETKLFAYQTENF